MARQEHRVLKAQQAQRRLFLALQGRRVRQAQPGRKVLLVQPELRQLFLVLKVQPERKAQRVLLVQRQQCQGHKARADPRDPQV
jgi:hypothetical protein